MMIAIRASTEAMTPKMMVPVESELDSGNVEAMVVFKARRDWRVEVVLSAGMVAVVCWRADLKRNGDVVASFR
jgi:hypothetical protein